ncbi:hypothetical protein V1478_008746 [Vespula squamosa]|uniref:Uncharacterized protein n=1 Tax=Vespula squamosa TaxID=30214 RepID=A0ABD2AUD6_VESSQ
MDTIVLVNVTTTDLDSYERELFVPTIFQSPTPPRIKGAINATQCLRMRTISYLRLRTTTDDFGE